MVRYHWEWRKLYWLLRSMRDRSAWRGEDNNDTNCNLCLVKCHSAVYSSSEKYVFWHYVEKLTCRVKNGWADSAAWMGLLGAAKWKTHCHQSLGLPIGLQSCHNQ
jgi:hypothetical protein